MEKIAAYDLKIGMEFIAQGTAGNVYKLFMIDWETKEVRLKRVKDGEVFKYSIDRFIQILPVSFSSIP